MNNSKKALVVTTVASTIDQFCMRNIRMLQGFGYQVEVAANFQQGSTTSDSRIREFRQELSDMGVTVHDIGFQRSVTSLDNLRAYRQIRKIVRSGSYRLIHCHTPVGAMLVRLAARKERKKGTKVIYTAHGFHFFQGAPRKNWMLYYPVEKFCSRFTDAIITINHEDYELARKKMKASRIFLIHGVGIDSRKIADLTVDRKGMRDALGVEQDSFVVLCVGELNQNKNHETVIRAIAQLKDPRVVCLIAGQGYLKESLEQLIDQLGLRGQVHLLGYRSDVLELCHVADIFCFLSFREGLGVAALEAMAAGLPLITSNIHGINDYSQQGVTGFKTDPTDVQGVAKAMQSLRDDENLRKKMGEYNQEKSLEYDFSRVDQEMETIYQELLA